MEYCSPHEKFFFFFIISFLKCVSEKKLFSLIPTFCNASKNTKISKLSVLNCTIQCALVWTQ